MEGPEAPEDSIDELSQELAASNCLRLVEVIASRKQVTSIDGFRTAFITYLDAFQNAFRAEVKQKFLENKPEQADEPWFTDYVTLKPLKAEESAEKQQSSSSLKKKAQKITKKAVVLLSNSSK